MQQATGHHEIFQRFRGWERAGHQSFAVDFLGVRTREVFFPGAKNNKLIATPFPPEFSEEYFEWISLLTAVTEARHRFTMVELGAGWGRWLVRAAAAVRQTSRLPLKLIGVEAEPSHYRYMRHFFRDNGLNPNEHWLIEGAVSDKPGTALFYTGNPDQWYGQCIVTDPEQQLQVQEPFAARIARLFKRHDKKKIGVRKVKSVSLDSILKTLDRVDLVDADIQGAEAAVFEASSSQLDTKVRAVHIGTHSQEQESRLRRLFTSMRWEPVFDYPCQKQADTPWGTISFEDGVQAWKNRQPAVSVGK